MRRKGICMVCGCTDEEGCAEGCEWANLKHTLCSACEPLSDAERKTKRTEAIAELEMRKETTEQELRQLTTRLEVLRA